MNFLFAYIFLIAAVIFGTSSNIYAKYSNGFTKITPSFVSIITIILCMYCLSQVMKTFSPGIAYGIFAGMCIVSTIVMSILKFNQWPNLYSLIGMVLIILGVILVNFFGYK